MSKKKRPDQDSLMMDVQVFKSAFKTALLATSDRQGTPEASAAPYIEDRGSYYVYVSELARHTSNILQNPRVSLMFIEDESGVANPFARKRLVLKCSAVDTPRDSKDFDCLLDGFEKTFGPFMQVLRTLPDFHLFRLQPESGTFVTGFAKAYQLTGKDLGEIRHIGVEDLRRRDTM